MTDLIIFGVANNKYALDIENIQRIIQCSQLTDIPNSNQAVEGMMSYEEGVIKVLSFRKIIGIETYEDNLSALFKKLKSAHVTWIEALKDSVHTGSAFQHTTNPHICELGVWIDDFTSYDERVNNIFKELAEFHNQLHIQGGEALELYKSDEVAAQEMLDTEITNTYHHTMSSLDTFVAELESVANSFQKLIIYENSDKIFAIKIDTIEDIAHVEESDIISSDDSIEINEFLELGGVLDLDGVLINVIKTLHIPR